MTRAESVRQRHRQTGVDRERDDHQLKRAPEPQSMRETSRGTSIQSLSLASFEGPPYALVQMQHALLTPAADQELSNGAQEERDFGIITP